MKRLLCENCGNAELTKTTDGYVCHHCGTVWQAETIDSVYVKLSDILDDYKQEQLANARNNLYKATHEQYLSAADIVRCIGEVQNYYPEDFLAGFYKIVIGNDHKQINNFLASVDVDEHRDYMDVVLPFMFKVMERENLLSVSNLISRAFEQTNPKYIKFQSEFELCAEKINSELYDVTYPRDVFVAYKSEDMPKVMELVQFLEDNGLECFVSARNLRHGKDAVGSYDEKLQMAIDNCRIVVFVSSHKSRTTGDARHKELPYIRQKDIENAPAEYKALGDYTKIPPVYKKGRVEYLIEDYKGFANERFVKQFFDGLNWANDPQMVYDAIDDIFSSPLPKVNDPAEILAQQLAEQEERRKAEESKREQERQKALQEEQARKQRLDEQAKALEEQQQKLEAQKKQFEQEQKALAEERQRLADEKIAQAEEQREEEKKKKMDSERKTQEETRSASELAAAALRAFEEEAMKAQQEAGNQEQERIAVEKSGTERNAQEETEHKAQKNFSTLDNYDKSEFEIKGTILKKYNGNKPEVVIPQGVTSIGEYAFSQCEGLTSITIPNSVTSVGIGAFCGCDRLTRIIFPSSVTSIGCRVFGGCNALESIQVENGNKVYAGKNNCLIDIEKNILVVGCKNSVIPTDGSVVSIGYEAFFGCEGLTSITIPNSVSDIGDRAFFECEELTSIIIPDSVTSIGKGAFCGCSSLTSITIPDSVISIGYDAFSYCTDLTNISLPNSVTSIGDRAFCECEELASIIIPDSVTSIGYGIFYGCNSLTSITIPSSVTKIDEDAFCECESLTSIIIPNSVTDIYGSVFNGCLNLKTIYCEAASKPKDWDDDWLGYGVDKCPAKVIWGYKNSSLHTTTSSTLANYDKSEFEINGTILKKYRGSKTEVVIPNGVTSIYRFAFNGCENLTSITIPNSITSISDNAFMDCSSLRKITIPNSVISIGYGAFIRCSSLRKITIPNSVISIGERAFSQCDSLISITIPNSVTFIGDGAFAFCDLTSITVENGNKNYYVKNNCLIEISSKKLMCGCNSSVIPTDGSVTSIADEAFAGCENLTNLKIPNSVTTIGEMAFFNCSSLTSITISNSVTSIGERAFRGCSSLTNITIPNSVVFIGKGAFEDYEDLKTIYCEATNKPKGWDDNWLSEEEFFSGKLFGKCPVKVIWGYKGK